VRKEVFAVVGRAHYGEVEIVYGLLRRIVLILLDDLYDEASVLEVLDPIVSKASL
jgi:hypothetical protein